MSSSGLFAGLRGDGPGGEIRTVYRSPVLHIAVAPSNEIAPIVAGVSEHIKEGTVRYYLSAGTDRFARPPWSFCRRGASRESPRVDSALVQSILYCREERDAAVDREIKAVESWLADADAAPRCLLMEILGSPSRNDVAFLQACRLRLPRASTRLPSMVVLQHAQAGFDNGRAPADHKVDDILLALLLAGGHVPAPVFERWSTLRGWDQGLIAALTSTRESAHGRLYTYAGSCQRSRAWATYAAAERTLVAEVAAMVVSVEPSIAAAALVDDPQRALAAFRRWGCAEAANSGSISLYGRNLFRNGWNDRWTGISKEVAATVCLAAIVADRRQISPPFADALLSLAERFEVDTDVRSLLAYSLGQMLAKTTSAQSWAASIRCFEYARTCTLAKVASDREVDGSRLAASYNGAALAHYRAGDRHRAVAAELAGLEALAAPGVVEKGHLYDQQVLLLANLAKVLSVREESRTEALERYRRAWHIASDTDSLAGMAYVAVDLVGTLIAAREYAEAETVTKQLLRQYDAAADPSVAERAVVASCWRLADVNLAEGAVHVAADWYAESVRRLHRAAPEVIKGMTQNLRRQQQELPPASVMDLLEEELTAHTAMAAELRALLGLLAGV